MSVPGAFLLDFGNILIDIDIPGATARLTALVRPGVDEGEAFHRMHVLVRGYERGALTSQDFIAGIREMAAPHISDAEIIDAWNSMLIGIPAHRLDALEKLHAHYPVYMLSNTNTLHVAWIHTHLLDLYGIADFETRFFRQVFYSHLIGQRKPDAAAFQYVLDQAGLDAKTTLFIDDMHENIAAAERLGLQVHHSPPEEDVCDFFRSKGYL